MAAVDCRFVGKISLAVSAISFLSWTKSGFMPRNALTVLRDSFRGFICFLPFVRRSALFGFWPISLLPFVLFVHFPCTGAGVLVVGFGGIVFGGISWP